MIEAVLTKETCGACKNCCWYTDTDIWDAPGFMKSELARARRLVANPVYEKYGLFFFQMDKRGDKYICPLLGKTGCLLEAEKPFKCAIWPLYAVRIHGRTALAVSNECPAVYHLSNQELIDRLGSAITKIEAQVRETPELIEPFREHFRIVVEFN